LETVWADKLFLIWFDELVCDINAMIDNTLKLSKSLS
jgi:hypothetical protein